MKTKNMKKILGAIMLVIFYSSIMVSCAHADKDPNIDYYTCSMHPQIHMDEPGNCPICGMKLVPVYKENSPAQKESHEGHLKIPEDKQKMIGITTATVKMTPAKKTLRTFSKVAFDPQLAATQKEYIEILAVSPSLEKSARTRLKLMGMSEDEIDILKKNRKSTSSLYLPDAQNKTWVYATVYENDAPLISEGMAVTVKTPSGKNEKISGTVRSLSPTIDATTRTLTARIELNDTTTLKPNAYVDVYFEIDLGSHLTIPKSALINTGERKIAYVVNDDEQFLAHEITVLDEAGDDVVLGSGLNEGDIVATNATFLIDSETQLRGQTQETN